MPDFHGLIRERLRNCGLSPLREAEIVEELAQHLRQRYDALRSGGSSEEQAFAAIITHLDQRDLAGELRRVEHPASEPIALGAPASPSFWTALRQDVRYGLRMLRLNPGFTTVCVLSLALGIGANTAIFQLIDAVRMRTVPVKDPQELFVLRPTENGRTGDMTGRYSYSTNAMWQQVRALEQGYDVFAFGTTSFNLARGGEARYAEGLWVSGDFFDVLGVQPLLGRVFHAADDHAGCGSAGAVISYSFWQREFGGDPNVIGRTVSLTGHPFPVVGVTPANFYGLEVGRKFDVAALTCSEPVIDAPYNLYTMPHGWWLGIIGRLKPGWPAKRASAQLESISSAVMQASLPPVYVPDQAKKYLGMKLGAFPAANGLSRLRRDYETPLWLLLAIAGLVLMIACANLANLMLARANAREREIAVRLALGAARGRIVRQLLTESLLLAFFGALFGVGLARLLSGLLVTYLSGERGRLFLTLNTDWRVLGFTAALAILTCILFGLAPALKATSAPPARIMSLAGRGLTAARERFSLRRGLVVVQVALSMLLVVTAVLFAGSLRKLLTVDAGFQRDGLLLMDFDFTALNLPVDQRMPFAESLLDRVRALPGIEGTAEAGQVPLGGSYWNNQVVADGKKSDEDVDMSHISPGYFKTMGTPLLAGRDFDNHDRMGAPNVAIVNQEFARKILHTENPVGRTFKIDVYQGEPQVEYQIVGLVRDSKYVDLREKYPMLAYYPQLQDAKAEPNTEVIVRSSMGLEPLLDSLRNTVRDVNPAIAIDFHPYNRMVKEGLLRERLLATLSGFFGGLAIVLATIGLYGVIAYLVVRRTNEIGIRMALGATPARILGMVVREAATLLLGGLAAGILLALLAGRQAAALLYDLKPYDPPTMLVAALGLSAVALAASLVPARRAAHLEPTKALREE
ncbi:MAG TPA: ABC transporter permease [Terriglobales bacterium]|nr:ABC transporter permease [Terriglobales bacterium]